MPSLDELVIKFIQEHKLLSSTNAENAAEEMILVHPDLEDSHDFGDIIQAFERLLKTHGVNTPKPAHKEPAPSTQKKDGPNTNKKRAAPDVVSAPYRFVSVENRVIPGSTLDLGTPQPDHLSASIAVTWEAEGPLLIGEARTETIKGKGQKTVIAPFTLGGESDYAIPGASLRGMIRAAVETVAMARLSPVNGHHRYGLRDFTHPEYKELANTRGVGAGWLTCDGDPEDENTRWTLKYGMTWRRIPVEDLLEMLKRKDQTRLGWIGSSLEEKYRQAGMTDGPLYDFTKTCQVSFPDDKKVCHCGTEITATLVFADMLPGENGNKKYEYVFYGEPPLTCSFEGTAPVIREFRRLNSRPSANRPVPDATYKKLLETLKAERRVPVFFIGDPAHPYAQQERFSFGFTRLFKAPHKRSVGDVLRDGHPHHKIEAAQQHTPDFVENLFGYVVEPTELGMAEDTRVAASSIARRGRVAFSTAILAPQQRPRRSDVIETVLMGPRPSFAPFYLGNNSDLDYSPSTGTARLAGRKRYLPRFPASPDKPPEAFVTEMARQQLDNIPKAQKGKPVSDNVKCWLRFLLPEPGQQSVTFTSTIRLTNVSPAELGAVLFALTHGGCLIHSGAQAETPFRHMIGHAKPFGAGQLKVEAAALSVEWNSKAGKEVQVEHRPFLEAFQQHMRANGVRKFPDNPSLREFLGACCPAETAKIGEDNLGYMTLEEYQTVRKAYTAHNKEPCAPLKNTHGTASVEKPVTRLLPAPSYTVPS